MNALAQFTPLQIANLETLKWEFPRFAATCLRIRDKEGVIHPFKLNRAQRHIHDRLEEQRQQIGRVRAIIVKARQVGCSTYIEGRFYHRLWGTSKSLRAFILTHEQPATDNLFGMAERFAALHPPGTGKPPIKTGNAKELIFGHNDCGYQVSTAGTKETGRSATFQLFHGSEVAFWANAQNIASGAFNTVGDVTGTEILLESTGNGAAGFFHNAAQAALRGDSDFILIFIPWHWDDNLRELCPESWDCPKAWQEYGNAHSLEWDQLYWAYRRNRAAATAVSAPFDEPCWLFKQEFPATFDEAFQSSQNAFIPDKSVLRARKVKQPIIGSGPIILGVDPARSVDKVGIIDRCGRRAGERICLRMDPGGSSTYVADQIAQIIDRLRPDMVNIDVGSNGGPVYDILFDRGFGKGKMQLNPVNFGSNPVAKGPTGQYLHANRRAEMWDAMRAWFDGDLPVQIPDDESLQADICAPKWGPPPQTRRSANNELFLEEKEEIKKRLGSSPDLGDALALTFAVPYSFDQQSAMTRSAPRRGNRRSGY